jgi:hypothetical protein
MSSPFDINFKLLPPDLQVKLWVLSLDANTSKVNLAYKAGNFSTGLEYNYGGNAQAFLGIPRFSMTLGTNPTSGTANVDLGLVFRGFNFGTTANFTRRTASASLGYGAKLLPFPDELQDTFNKANGGLQNMAKDIQAAPNNPLAWYGLHNNDFSTISSAIDIGQQIADRNKDDGRFGFGLRLNYDPKTHLTVYGGFVYNF